ncbi:MAG: SHOCT domain-containing protein [Mycobacteriales bacterium]
MWHDGYDSTAWLAMAGMMTLMSALTAVVVIAIVKSTREGSKGSTALRLLDERYARGELDSEDYVERRRQLLER